ncbi:hypothetical protein [Saccharopolyspora spinosa]|uniref:hypothetical protein n=1 Tax=Saccharopolyspora spinosa TaxID=60894 RepID=UPI00376F45BA
MSSEDKDVARRIVQGTHDVRRLAGRGAVVSLDEVVALVAAKQRELGDDQRDRVVEFSRALAGRLGTQGSGLSIRPGPGRWVRLGVRGSLRRSWGRVGTPVVGLHGRVLRCRWRTPRAVQISGSRRSRLRRLRLMFESGLRLCRMRWS